MKNFHFPGVRPTAGFSLLEVLIAVVVFSTGLLALAALQGALSRGSADAKTRSEAVSCVSSAIDAIRDQAGSVAGYLAMTGSAGDCPSQAAADMSFTVGVTRWVPNAAENPTGYVQAPVNYEGSAVTTSEYKELAVTVNWTDELGLSRSLAFADIISPAANFSGQTLIQRPIDRSKVRPIVRTDRPDTEAGVIPIGVGDDQATAATNPKPVLTRRGEYIETRFDVITFREDGLDALVQRRVETALVNCRCSFGNSSGLASNHPAYATRRPTYWDGVRYTQPEVVAGAPEAWSVVPGNKEPSLSPLCDECCRDHRDSGLEDVKFDNNRSQHIHYALVGGVLQEATSGQYLESCRLVRVDGIMRVATDMRANHMNFLRTDNDAKAFVPPSEAAASYESFVIDLMKMKIVDGTEPTADQVTALENTYTLNNPQSINIAADPKDRRYSHVRGLYVDHLETPARERIAKAIDECPSTLTPVRCALVYTPFVSINLSELADYTANPPASLTVTNLSGMFGQGGEPVSGRVNAFSTSPSGPADIDVDMSYSNSALTLGRSINPEEDQNILSDRQVYVIGGGGSGGTPFTFRVNVTAPYAFDFGNSPLPGWTINPLGEPQVCEGTKDSKNDKDPNPFRCAVDPAPTAGLTLAVTRYSGIGGSARITDPCRPNRNIQVPTRLDYSVSSVVVGGVSLTIPAPTDNSCSYEETRVLVPTISDGSNVSIAIALQGEIIPTAKCVDGRVELTYDPACN